MAEEGWETESQDSSNSNDHKTHLTMPPLLPVPVDLVSSEDKLCEVCAGLQLRPEEFVVSSSDYQSWNKPDDISMFLGNVEDVSKKKRCPFCRLVLVALGDSKVPSVEDGMLVHVVMSWNTNGPIPDPNQPWNHIPQVRVLRPYARKSNGGFVNNLRLNLFPEITLLANDSPVPTTTFFARPIDQSKIDFGMVRSWVSMCKTYHGGDCNRSSLNEHERSHPSEEVPGFRVIDVNDNCLVRVTTRVEYVTLSYVWGQVDFFRTSEGTVEVLEKPGALQTTEIWAKIPWTIRDAMEVCREIGMRYLWVDCLCIVQDDETGEKANAISKMDSIYGAAFLTIIAATGSDADHGLPGVRPGTRGFRQPIEQIAPNFRLAFKSRSVDFVEDCVYHKRAWTWVCPCISIHIEYL